MVIILHNDKNIDFHKKISISSPKNSLLKVLSEKRRRGRHGNKKYDEGVGCGRTNQQLDLYIRVCALVMHYFTRSTSLKCTPVKFRVTLIHQYKLNVYNSPESWISIIKISKIIYKFKMIKNWNIIIYRKLCYIESSFINWISLYKLHVKYQEQKEYRGRNKHSV